MSIVYTEELDMIHEKSIISERVDFDPAIYIYIERLMKEKSKTFNEVLNDIIREHAENSLTRKIEYIPYTQPVTIPSTAPSPFWDPNKITCTCDSSDNYDNNY